MSDSEPSLEPLTNSQEDIFLADSPNFEYVENIPSVNNLEIDKHVD